VGVRPGQPIRADRCLGGFGLGRAGHARNATRQPPRRRQHVRMDGVMEVSPERIGTGSRANAPHNETIVAVELLRTALAPPCDSGII
jgi:hypothetical protein